MNGDVVMHHVKNCENKSSLSNTIKINSPYIICPGKGFMLDILDSISKGTSCFYNFSHGASLQRHSFSCALVHVSKDKSRK